MSTMPLGDADLLYQHVVGDSTCTEGWCGTEYPKECPCGGLIHASFGDESGDGYWLYTKCDQCGCTEDE